MYGLSFILNVYLTPLAIISETFADKYFTPGMILKELPSHFKCWQVKAVPLHAMQALKVSGTVAPNHS
jgi:hypothetical protein